MSYRILRFIGYLIFSLSFGIIVTLVVGDIENISQVKKIKNAIKKEIKNTASSYRHSSPNADAEQTITFLKNYITYVMHDRVVAVDDINTGIQDSRDLKLLFTFTEGEKHLGIYIKNSYLEKTAYAIDPPELIDGFIVTLVVFTSIVIYSEKRRQTLELQKKHETETAELTKALQEHEALALLGRIAATLAHELRTPISTISNLVQVLPDRLSDTNFTKRFITITKEELQRTQQLIDNLLVYGKEITITNDEWIPFKGFIEELSKVIGLRIVSCPDFKICGDKFYLRLLIENLMRNSLQANADRVLINVNNPASGGNPSVDIIYEDNGTGFPPDADLKKIINPFVTSRPKGAGLGLYLVQKIALAHNGTVSLYRLPKGAGVRITLPPKRVKFSA